MHSMIDHDAYDAYDMYFNEAQKVQYYTSVVEQISWIIRCALVYSDDLQPNMVY